jgi:hypothetical protein
LDRTRRHDVEQHLQCLEQFKKNIPSSKELRQASAGRFPVLESTGTKLLPTVVVPSGADRLNKLMHRDWPGHWKFRSVTDATMRGPGMMTPTDRD